MVPILVSEKVTRLEIVSILRAFRPEFLWIPREFQTDFFVAYKKVDLSLSFGDETCHYDLWKKEEEEKSFLYDELALLLSTSGSMGDEKYVRISYQNLYRNTKDICDYLHIADTDRTITTLPMSYTYGLSIINTYLMSGAAIVLNRKSVLQPEFWKQVEEYNVTSISGVPYTFELLKKIKFHHKSFPGLTVLTQAGGALSVECEGYMKKYCEKNGIKFFSMYGQTEATARMSYLEPELFGKKSGSIGKPIGAGTFLVIDDEYKEIKSPYQKGQLVYKGENVSLGYAKTREDLKKGDDNSGTLFTGDFAYFDEDGYYYIAGRIKRIAKIYGVRIDLELLEQKISSESGQSVLCVSDDEKVYVISEEAIERKHIKRIGNIPICYRVLSFTDYRSDSEKIKYSKLLQDLIKEG